MVSISGISRIDVNNAQTKGMSLTSNSVSSSKTFKVLSFGQDPDKSKAEEYKHDTVIKDSFSNKFKVDMEKTMNIPLVHFPRGLGGAPDYSFFEFLQTAKFPYYVGGPILAALFYAGVKFDNPQSGRAAKNVAKHMAVGVGLYYAGAMLAKSIINTTVKHARGINLEQPYRKVIPTSTDQTGAFQKDVEYHKVYESMDFTRWDMLYKEGNKVEDINARYNQIAKKYGTDPDKMTDSDSTLKPLIKKTIVMARAWQYALTAMFVSLGIGMANQKAWTEESMHGFKEIFKNGIISKKGGLKTAGAALKYLTWNSAIKPLGKSFTQFWHGQNKLTSAVGKGTIITTALATVLANVLILTKTSAKKHKTEKLPETNPNEVKQ